MTKTEESLKMEVATLRLAVESLIQDMAIKSELAGEEVVRTDAALVQDLLGFGHKGRRRNRDELT